jgi:DNA invertase Pin-like site-specific DNA recombinase
MLNQELKTPTTERAVLYARTALEDHQRTVEQLTVCRQYAEDKGYLVVVGLADYGSGLSLELPQLDHIRQIVHEFDVLIVIDISRLSRSLQKLAIIEDELKQAGVRIECILTVSQSPRMENNNQC